MTIFTSKTPVRSTESPDKMVQNKALIYADHPTAAPVAGKHLKLESSDFDIAQAPPAGGLTVRVNYVSFDPYQRGRMRKAERASYNAPFEIGKPITNTSIVSVIKSDNASFKPKQVLLCQGGNTEEYSVLDKEQSQLCKVLDNPYNLDEKLFLGSLGMPGLTAYSSLYEIGRPKAGEVIFVSAASGAVGQLVGQLAKREGLTVFGSVGDDRKLDFIVNQLGFDGGFNYKKEQPLAALQRLAPSGIDIYYDNVSQVSVNTTMTNRNTRWGQSSSKLRWIMPGPLLVW